MRFIPSTWVDISDRPIAYCQAVSNDRNLFRSITSPAQVRFMPYILLAGVPCATKGYVPMYAHGEPILRHTQLYEVMT